MVEGLIGIKIGMKQVFDEDGTVIPTTILKAGPCVVVQRKEKNKDGYEAIQLGLVENKRSKNTTKPLAGHFKRAGVPATRILREVKFSPSEKEIKIGDQILVSDVFKINDQVNVIGTSKGRGFAGVMRRHNFRGGPAAHGSMFHRAPGSIGASSYPSRVIKGTKMGGHMGMERVTVRNLRIVRLDDENSLIAVKGAVPGRNGGYLLITKV